MKFFSFVLFAVSDKYLSKIKQLMKFILMNAKHSTVKNELIERLSQGFAHITLSIITELCIILNLYSHL